MSAPVPAAAPGARHDDASTRRDNLAVLRLIRDNIPMLAAANGALCLCLLPALACEVVGISVAAPVLAFAAFGAVAAGVAANVLRLLDEEHVGWRAWWASARAVAPHGARVGLLWGVLAAAAQGGLAASQTRHATLALVPLVLDGACLVLAAATVGYVLVLDGLRGRRVWWAALWCAARSPAVTLATLVVVAIGLALVIGLGPGLLLVVPAPLLVALTALARPAVAARTPGDE